MILQFGWQGLSLALLGTRLSEHTRVGRVPTSYPTASTRRLMRPAANARTDPKVYVDCREDYRISATIYTNRLSKSRVFQFVENFLFSFFLFPFAIARPNCILAYAKSGVTIMNCRTLLPRRRAINQPITILLYSLFWK
jgi:hypothetical protein